ncbi:MAG: histidine--tRNA ligase [Thermodesulfobacteriota bacterium]|nr:MAG: histidine--tRNA ligase [Thermodesulfobacteriota bacterium]
MKVKSIRGFHDILPENIKRWHLIEDAAKYIFELYGFSEIRIPVLEFTDVFARSLGTTTDIVEKEMYTFTDRDGSSLTLRPEGTAGVVRAYIEDSMHAKSSISKLYYTGMMFRHERPQKGRFRGFYQIGAELIGPEEPASDAELVAMLWRFFEEIDLTQFLELEISSLGDQNCRPQYKEKLVGYFSPQKNELCEDCQRRLETNPLRILDCKQKRCKEIAADAPSMLDNLCEDCENHFDSVKENLDSVGIPYKINPKIVRGLDYYTRTVFEITTDQLGSQNAVAAGGRYDGLVNELGGPATAAVGFAMGIERIILLQEIALPEGFGKDVNVFIAHLGDEARQAAFTLAFNLRNKGISVETDYATKSLKSQMKRADKLGASYTFIIGEDELKKAVIKVRDMKESSEEDIKLEDIINSSDKFKS